MTCRDCGETIAYPGKTGLCRPCFARRMGIAGRGEPKTPEHRAKIAAGQRRAWRRRRKE